MYVYVCMYASKANIVSTCKYAWHSNVCMSSVCKYVCMYAFRHVCTVCLMFVCMKGTLAGALKGNGVSAQKRRTSVMLVTLNPFWCSKPTYIHTYIVSATNVCMYVCMYVCVAFLVWSGDKFNVSGSQGGRHLDFVVLYLLRYFNSRPEK